MSWLSAISICVLTNRPVSTPESHPNPEVNLATSTAPEPQPEVNLVALQQAMFHPQSNPGNPASDFPPASALKTPYERLCLSYDHVFGKCYRANVNFCFYSMFILNFLCVHVCFISCLHLSFVISCFLHVSHACPPVFWLFIHLCTYLNSCLCDSSPCEVYAPCAKVCNIFLLTIACFDLHFSIDLLDLF